MTGNEPNSNNQNARSFFRHPVWQGAGGAIVVAVIGLLIFFLKPVPTAEAIPEQEIQPAPTPIPTSVSLVITIGTHPSLKGAGTDSDLQIEVFNGNIQTHNLLFEGGRGDDIILERGQPASSHPYDNQRALLADKVRITLLRPTGNGGHWYGTTFQISSSEQNLDLCTSRDIEWLVAGDNTIELVLAPC